MTRINVAHLTFLVTFLLVFGQVTQVNAQAAGPDVDPPTPDPNFSAAPYATSSTSIAMACTTAYDPNGVEYYFECTAGGGNDSGWQDNTDYEDIFLSTNTLYSYRVKARDKSVSQSETIPSSSSSATTLVGSSSGANDYANADIPVTGTVSGDYTDTQSSDDSYESIEEDADIVGVPSTRRSWLEHKWTIDVTGGDTVTFYVEAYHTANSEGDDFTFAYSTDDSTYTPMVVVTKTSDDDTAQSYALPASLSGTVYIRVTDNDYTGGNNSADTVYIDEMYIVSATTSPIPGQTSTPGPLNGATGISVDADITWTMGTDSTSNHVYFGTDPTPDASEYQGDQPSATFDPGTLATDTTYYWSIDSVNAYEITLGLIWNFTTGLGVATVPDVVGMTEAAATTAITDADFVLGTVTYACSDTVPSGDVISQDPTGGTSAPAGSSVDIVVSTGQPSPANLLTNPSFETGTVLPDSWETYGSGTFNWLSGIAHSGQKCMELGNTGLALMYQRVLGVVGQKYICKAWAKLNSGAGGAELKLEFHNSSEIIIEEHKLNLTATGTWLQYSIDGTAPPNTYYVTATVVGLAGGMVLFDDVSLEVLPKTTISANDPNILYTGRINFDDLNTPVLDWPGTSLVANFEGTSVTAILVDSGNNYFNAIIDDDANTIVLDCVPGLSYYNITSGLSDTVHKIEINKRTGSLQNSVTFNGFKLDESRSLVTPPSRPTNKIEYYGDSITVGDAVDDPAGGVPNKNNYLTYAAVTARNLNAEYHCIAMSGIGLQQSTNTGTMFDYYDKELGYYSPVKPWDFSQWIPDAIVINLGQNDYTLGSDPNVTDLYVDFMRDIRFEYPDAYIFLVLGDMTAVSPGSPYPGYLQSAVDIMKNTYSDTKVYQLTFDYGGTTHPTVARHEAMADVLTEFILDNVPGLLPPLDGDANGDYDVDYEDFAMVSKRWQDTSCGTCGGADLTGDGNVTMEDVIILTNNWLDDWH